MIAVKLKAAMERYRLRTGERLTYERLASLTGLSRATVEALASRPDYNTTLDTIEKLCRAFACTPADLLELIDEPPTAKRRMASPSPRSRTGARHGASNR